MTDIFRKIANQIINSSDFKIALEHAMATEVERAIKAEAAGDRFYVAKKSRDDIKHRNNLIRAQFNGRNIDQLAKDFNLKPRQIRNILKQSN
jgi:Mor family transcriptional regulator